MPVGDASVTASVHGAGGTAVALAHGAGGNRRNALLLRLAEALAASGRRAVLYNFPYTDRRSRLPDPPEVLEKTAAAVAEYTRASLGAGRVVLGGKSMGGRIASQAVAKGVPADGLVFLGYPLHPPGKTAVLRDRHLPQVRAPMLFLQGTRDAFARWDLVEALAARLGPTVTLHRVEDADHSFKVPKRSGRSADDVERSLFQAAIEWLDAKGL